MRELLIGGKNSSVYALLEDGKLVEWITDAGDQEAGELFVGKVERIVPGMSAAFIDIAQEKNGFLPISDDERRSLRCGASILVQIKRQAQGMKGAFLTRNVVLPGRYLLYLPLDREIGVSAKITDQLTRTELKETGNRLSKGECGLVMRTSSAGVPEEWLAEDLEQLKASWESIQKEVRSSSLPRHITGRSCLIRLLDDLLPRGLDRVLTADAGLFSQLSSRYPVNLVDKDPISGSDLERERNRALQKHVYLKNGGSLVIDECEALSVIDVNTQKFTGSSKKIDRTMFENNLIACPEIVRQIRLRNLCGIILIDMIDMESDQDRSVILEKLRECFQADRTKTVIHGFTSLGLVEITRKRSLPSLREQTSHICEHCHGTGYTIQEENHAGKS